MAEVKESSILIQDVETKNIMTKSALPVGGYSVNPYVGCTHGCKYCYASAIPSILMWAVPMAANTATPRL